MSQTVKASVRLRELILNGQFQPGERLLEVALVERLGVSRTPIRAALSRLADEGLLEKVSRVGYRVREFTTRDIQHSIEIRGTLEGIAARFAAEQGVSSQAMAKLKACVADIDDLLDKVNFSDDDIASYLALNEAFHQHLICLADSFVVERVLERIMHLPFASPNAFVIAQAEIDRSWKIFVVAQEQHKGIVTAIEERQGTRAEFLAREHALLALTVLQNTLTDKSAFEQVPGATLIANSVA